MPGAVTSAVEVPGSAPLAAGPDPAGTRVCGCALPHVRGARRAADTVMRSLIAAAAPQGLTGGRGAPAAGAAAEGADPTEVLRPPPPQLVLVVGSVDASRARVLYVLAADAAGGGGVDVDVDVRVLDASSVAPAVFRAREGSLSADPLLRHVSVLHVAVSAAPRVLVLPDLAPDTPYVVAFGDNDYVTFRTLPPPGAGARELALFVVSCDRYAARASPIRHMHFLNGPAYYVMCKPLCIT